MTIEYVLDYCMRTPDNMNRMILVELLERLDGAPNGIFSIEEVANYAMHTKYNTNRMVLETMLRNLKNDHPIRNKRTVLYEDGTFIINELAKDIEENTQRYGEVLNEYPPLDAEHDYVFPLQTDRYWANEIEQIKFAKFGSSVKPTSMRAWYMYCVNLESFDATNLDTSDCTSLRALFAGTMNRDLTKLKSLDLSSFNTSKVTSFKQMCNRCVALETLDISFFNTSSATDMSQMFNKCSSLTSLDVTNFNTSNVTDMQGMFSNCSSLTSLDVTNFNTSNVTDMQSMFSNCLALTTIFASTSFNTSNVSSSTSMFQNDTNLVGGAGTTYVDTSTGRSKTYARIDNPPDAPGYFTEKEPLLDVTNTTIVLSYQQIGSTPKNIIVGGQKVKVELSNCQVQLNNETTTTISNFVTQATVMQSGMYPLTKVVYVNVSLQSDTFQLSFIFNYQSQTIQAGISGAKEFVGDIKMEF